MNRLPAIVALVVFAAATAPLPAAAPDCVPQEKCAENISPPSCCSPPPCQIYEYLKQMRAFQRFSSARMAKNALRKSKGNHSQAIASLNAAIKDESGALKSASNAKCPFEGPFSAPTFSVHKCEVIVQKGAGWLKVVDAMYLLKEFEVCNELIEGEFARMNHLAESCIQDAPANVNTWAARNRNAAQDSIDSTVAHLQRYYDSCSKHLLLDEDALKRLEEVPEIKMQEPSQQINPLQLLQGRSAH